MIDLLNPGPKRVNLTVRWNKKSRAFVVDNLFAIECSELEDLVGVLEEGKGAFINYVTQVVGGGKYFCDTVNTVVGKLAMLA